MDIQTVFVSGVFALLYILVGHSWYYFALKGAIKNKNGLNPLFVEEHKFQYVVHWWWMILVSIFCWFYIELANATKEDIKRLFDNSIQKITIPQGVINPNHLQVDHRYICWFRLEDQELRIHLYEVDKAFWNEVTFEPYLNATGNSLMRDRIIDFSFRYFIFDVESKVPSQNKLRAITAIQSPGLPVEFIWQ